MTIADEVEDTQEVLEKLIEKRIAKF